VRSTTLAGFAARSLRACGVAAAGPGEDPADDEDLKQRLAFISKKHDEFSLAMGKTPDKRLSRTKEAVLWFKNPTRANAGGVISLWLLDDRPVAAASLWIRPDGGVWRESTSISDQPLNCTRGVEGRVVAEIGHHPSAGVGLAETGGDAQRSTDPAPAYRREVLPKLSYTRASPHPRSRSL
jgi:hypothetical protein